jgi:uncharacterized protein YndB with AHSA1/START domain
MAEYHFVSTWQIQAPIERVWGKIFHTELWPSWWKYVVRVDEMEPALPTGSAGACACYFGLGCRTRSDLTCA